MPYQFEYFPYQRRFKQPLQTSHGSWDVREGIIIRLTDKKGARGEGRGARGVGEIAPLSWFGSETLGQALEFCRQLPVEISDEVVFSIPNELPACQFGFESALGGSREQGAGTSWGAEEQKEFLSSAPLPLCPSASVPQSSLLERRALSRLYTTSHSPLPTPRSLLPAPCSLLPYSGLLPTGEAALQEWQALWHQGYRTFKWKIGVAAIQDELKIFHQLIEALPTTAKLRLDANGGLSFQEATQWLRVCDAKGIEFLEQPLSVEHFDAMLELSARYSTRLALDESVATLEQLETAYKRGWRGIFVIKPCIAGSPSRLRQFCREHEIDAVFSSVFETPIGRQAALKLASELSQHNRAVGFGVNHWFVEDDETWLSRLWNNL